MPYTATKTQWLAQPPTSRLLPSTISPSTKPTTSISTQNCQPPNLFTNHLPLGSLTTLTTLKPTDMSQTEFSLTQYHITSELTSHIQKNPMDQLSPLKKRPPSELHLTLPMAHQPFSNLHHNNNLELQNER